MVAINWRASMVGSELAVVLEIIVGIFREKFSMG
jgi:hypothetical protein